MKRGLRTERLVFFRRIDASEADLVGNLCVIEDGNRIAVGDAYDASGEFGCMGRCSDGTQRKNENDRMADAAAPGGMRGASGDFARRSDARSSLARSLVLRQRPDVRIMADVGKKYKAPQCPIGRSAVGPLLTICAYAHKVPLPWRRQGWMIWMAYSKPWPRISR